MGFCLLVFCYWQNINRSIFGIFRIKLFALMHTLLGLTLLYSYLCLVCGPLDYDVC